MKKLLFLLLLTPFAYAQSIDTTTKLTEDDWLNDYNYAMGTSKPMDGIVITKYCINLSIWQLIKTTDGEIISFAPRPSGESNISYLCSKTSKKKWLKRYDYIIAE
ncbi:hypothetical protein N9I51_00785 [Gammaproteobacteria bacterium]|nr:hypothetical protein [Gammaproteobacteria bacterium]